MSTFTVSSDQKELTAESPTHTDRRGTSPADEPKIGTIAIGLGGMNEQLQDAAVDAFLKQGQGPSLPPAFVKKDRREVRETRNVWNDQKTEPLAEQQRSTENAGQWLKSALALMGIVSLIAFTAWQMGPLKVWFQQVLG